MVLFSLNKGLKSLNFVVVYSDKAAGCPLELCAFGARCPDRVQLEVHCCIYCSAAWEGVGVRGRSCSGAGC